MFIVTKQEDHKCMIYEFAMTNDELMRSICYGFIATKPLFVTMNHCGLELKLSHLWPINGSCSKAINICFRDKAKVHLEGFGSGEEEREGHEDWHLLLGDSRIWKKKTEDLSIFNI